MPEPELTEAFRKLKETTQVEPVDLTAAALAEQLQREIDNRKTERCFWVFAIAMLVYVLAVIAMDSYFAPLGLFLLLIVFLIGIAAWQGVDVVVVLLQKLYAWRLSDKPPNADSN